MFKNFVSNLDEIIMSGLDKLASNSIVDPIVKQKIASIVQSKL